MNNCAEEVIEILLIEASSEYARLLGESLNPPDAYKFTITHSDRSSTGLKYLAETTFGLIL